MRIGITNPDEQTIIKKRKEIIVMRRNFSLT